MKVSLIEWLINGQLRSLDAIGQIVYCYRLVESYDFTKHIGITNFYSPISTWDMSIRMDQFTLLGGFTERWETTRICWLSHKCWRLSPTYCGLAYLTFMSITSHMFLGMLLNSRSLLHTLDMIQLSEVCRTLVELCDSKIAWAKLRFQKCFRAYLVWFL